jgi:dihydroflavonol-4-reductase
VEIDETLPFDPKNPAGGYDRTKAAASLAVQQAMMEGLDAVIVCPTGVIGPYDYRRSEMGEMILEWMDPKISILIDGAFDFVDVRDVARGHILAAERGRSGESYILSGERIDISSIRQMVKEFTGTYRPAIQVPLPVAMVAARFSELYYRLSKTRPRFTRYSLETVISNSLINCNKARQELGYRARSLRETILDTVMWWRENRLSIQPSLRA